MENLYGMTLTRLREICRDEDLPAFAAGQIARWLYVRRVQQVDAMTDLSRAAREKLARRFEARLTPPLRTSVSADGTKKYLFGSPDEGFIEAAYIPDGERATLCVSSQVGCRMGCRFCASTLGGLERNMTPSEMLEEVYAIQRDLGERISNVVIMGSGEPLDNYDNVVKFIKMLSDSQGLNISQRNITLSTCGIVPRIYDLAKEDLTITLAISLHAVSDERRRELMPVANTYSIDQILNACREYYSHNNRRLTFEYSLVKGVNDSETDAKALAALLKGINAHINLIQVNPIKERDFCQSEASAVMNFKNKLEKYGENVTIRREMGRDINGACGQLRNEVMSGKILKD